MNLIDAIKQKGSPLEIADCARNNLPAFFVQMGYKTGAEIGVYRGEFTEEFCKVGLTIFAVDPWMGYSGAGRSEKSQEMQEINLRHAAKRLSPYKNCRLVRKTSIQALNDFADNSLDFVYIDGDHRFKAVAEDISEWYKKVKPGGIISGHDYFCTNPKANNVICQVAPIVDAFIKTMQIADFYVFGKLEKEKQNSKGDTTLSWMFFKK